MNQEKKTINAGIKHGCDIPSCGKCLYSGCEDDNCPIHTLEAKEAWRKRMERMGRIGSRNKSTRPNLNK